MLRPYMLSPENAVTLGTQVRAKTQASGPANPLKKGAGQYRRPVIQAVRTRRQTGNSGTYGQTSFHRPKTPCFQKQLGLTGGPQASA